MYGGQAGSIMKELGISPDIVAASPAVVVVVKVPIRLIAAMSLPLLSLYNVIRAPIFKRNQ